MGNQHSNSGTRSHRHHRSGGANGPFRRSTGRLGLTKADLDIRCKPSGLYDSCSWDDKVIRRLIADGDIAARLEGTDSRTQSTDQECPICFLHYTDINLLSCCKATICSECYLQIQDPRAMDTPCPFCNQPKMEVKIAKRLEIDEVSKRDEEEQRIIEAKIKSKIEGLSGTCNNNSNGNSKSLNPQNDDGDTVADGDGDGDGDGDDDKNKENNGSSFGSNLDRAMRSRARTLSAELHESFGVIAMSPEERRTLEQEMSSQSQHPLLRRMNLEREQESDRHVLEHMNSRRDRNRASREQFERLMNWTSRNARERRAAANGGDGDDNGSGSGGNNSTPAVPSLNDLIMLEAAMYLSMREEPRSRRRSRIRNGRGLMFLGRDNQHHNEGDLGDPLQEREREHDRMEAANLFQSLVRDRMMTTEEEEEEEPNDVDQMTGSITDRLLTELSEARQIEMAIQMSLQEAQEREQSASEENTNTGDETTNTENEGGSGNNEDAAEAATTTTPAATTATATTTYGEVNLSNSVDHGEEEVSFEVDLEDA